MIRIVLLKLLYLMILSQCETIHIKIFSRVIILSISLRGDYVVVHHKYQR